MIYKIFLAIVMALAVSAGFAQVDDMYFIPQKEEPKKASTVVVTYEPQHAEDNGDDVLPPGEEPVYASGEVRDVDEYNRRGIWANDAALLGGHIDVCVGHPGEVMQYVESGDAVALGIFNDERDPRDNLKDIPTFKEMGYDVTMSVWKFLMVPASTPDEIVTEITETLNAITATDKYKEFCDANQLLPLTMTTDEMVQRIKDEAAVNQALLAGES